MKKICVFCGSRTGSKHAYITSAKQFAQCMIEQQIELVYGAGSVGLMGVISNEILSAGGRVTGVIPQHLCKKELLQDGLTELHITENLMERKRLMMDLSDAFVALPGGLGTFDELFEVLTWNQLGQLSKPVALLNIEGYFDPILATIGKAIKENFLDKNSTRLIIESDPLQLINQLY